MRRAVIILGIILLAGGTIFAQDDNIWTLGECIEYAYSRNITVRKSELANQKYSIYAEQAKAQRFPSVNASANYNFNWSKSSASNESGLTGSNGSNISLNSVVTVFNASRLTNQIKQAELDVESGIYSLETTKESISLSILNAYLQILYAEEQVKNSEKQIEATAEQLRLAGERLLLKGISQADYAQCLSSAKREIKWKDNFG